MSDDIANRIAVKDLIDRYSDAITRGDFACVDTLFTRDAVWRVGPPFNMHLEGAVIAQGLAAALKDFEMLMQAALNSVITVEGDRATARTMIHEMGKNGAEHFSQFGIYQDVAVRADGQWRFASRYFHALYRDTTPLPGTSYPLNIEI